MPSGQDYANRLREETRTALEPRLSGLKQEFASVRNRLSESIDQLVRKLDEIALLDFSPSAAEIISEARKEELVFLSRFSSDMRKLETQEEILDLLLDAAHRYAPKAALFVTRGDRFGGWAGRGHDYEVLRNLSEWSGSAGDSEILKKAATGEEPFAKGDPESESVLRRLLPDASAPCYAFPMKALRRPVAVLLVSASEERGCDLESLAILMNVTGLCVENVALRILQEMKETQPARDDSDRVAPETSNVFSAATSTEEEAEEPPAGRSVSEWEESVPAQPETAGGTPSAGVDASPAPTEEEEPAAESTEETQAGSEYEEEATDFEKPAARGDAGEPEAADDSEAIAAHSLEESEAVEESEEPEAAEESEPAADRMDGTGATDIKADRETPPAAGAMDAAGGRNGAGEVEKAPADDSAPGVPHREEQLTPTASDGSGEDSGSSPVERPSPSGMPVRPVYSIREAAGAGEFTEEERLHADAKRFARLLASEIKLYNEERVRTGRENRDLYTRLKRDIDRSREMYQKRVSPIVARKVDHFHSELIRILGEDDPSTLGSDYPGPHIGS